MPNSGIQNISCCFLVGKDRSGERMLANTRKCFKLREGSHHMSLLPVQEPASAADLVLSQQLLSKRGGAQILTFWKQLDVLK